MHQGWNPTFQPSLPSRVLNFLAINYGLWTSLTCALVLVKDGLQIFKELLKISNKKNKPRWPSVAHRTKVLSSLPFRETVWSRLAGPGWAWIPLHVVLWNVLGKQPMLLHRGRVMVWKGSSGHSLGSPNYFQLEHQPLGHEWTRKTTTHWNQIQFLFGQTLCFSNLYFSGSWPFGSHISGILYIRCLQVITVAKLQLQSSNKVLLWLGGHHSRRSCVNGSQH